MTVYNKLKIAMLTLLATQPLHAIMLEPLQVMSAPGDLLYAEMNFSDADVSSNLQVSLATPEDLMGLGIVAQPTSQFNFFARRNGQGAGVIVITSSRPFTQPELDIVLKIQEGRGTRLQHIKQAIHRKAPAPLQASNEKTLTPKFIVSEKDIALNLPESTQYAVATPVTQSFDSAKARRLETPDTAHDASMQSLAINTVTPPALQTTLTPQSVNTQQTVALTEMPPAHLSIKETLHSKPATTTVAAQTQPPAQIKPVQPATEQPAENAANQTNKATPTPQKKPDPTETPAKSNHQTTVKSKMAEENKHIVQRNESLWSIAQRISVQTNQPITQVMQQIKTQNSHAFIQGDSNRLRQGVALNLSASTHPATQKTVEIQSPVTSTQSSGRAKYRLNQAEMSLVADREQDSMQGSAKHNTKQEQSNAELSLKVMTAREKTVKLQQSVTEMELALRQKEQRIQLLNARLAQLQQQLKARESAKKSNH